jgi:hypothetical protein
MQKEKHVRIDLPSRDGSDPCDPQVKFKKSKRDPTAYNFRFVPASAKEVQSLVLDVNWNSVEKTISLKVKENVHFDVYNWVESIKKTYVETQKGPFVDLDQDAILLHFLDHLGHEVSTMKFKELKLVAHEVNLAYKKENPAKDLIHKIKIQYKDAEQIEIEEFVDWSERSMATDNDESDEEWQTVET